jgi:flagellar biosynthesis protein FlhF
MSIKRFFAKTTSEALRKVRDALGPEGVILSNRPVDGGIEILALRQDEITALMSPSAPREPEAERSEGGSTFLSHVLSGNQARVNEGKTNAGKTNPDEPAHEVKAFSPGSPKGLSSGLKNVKKTGLADRDSPWPGHSSRQHIESKQESREPRNQKLEAKPDSEFTEWDWSRPIAVNAAAAEQKALNEAVDAARMREAPITAPRFAQNLHQSGANKVNHRAHRGADEMASHKASHEANHEADRAVDHMTAQWERNQESEAEIPGKRPRSSRRAVAEIPSDPASTQKRKSKQASVIDTRELAAEVTSSLLKEIKSMRNALEQQFSSLNWNGHERRGAVREHLLRNLLAAGFSIPLANGLMAQLPEHRDDGNGEEDAMNHIKTTLLRNLKTISSEDEILEKGGIYALVGPTGVGKTTTTAKLAARCVVRHGADKLALLTTDGYRIGGHEQLRIYGKILGVTVYAVKDAQDLALALGELRGKHMVLIDTVGVGQRDQMVAEQIAMFAGCGTEVKRLLLLNASSNLHTLNEVAEAYGGHGLAGAIITKLDEAVVVGCALDTAIRHHLPLYYVAQGQRVPEDLELANPRSLVDLALENSPASPHFGLAHTFPLVMAHSQAANTQWELDGAGLD